MIVPPEVIGILGTFVQSVLDRGFCIGGFNGFWGRSCRACLTGVFVLEGSIDIYAWALMPNHFYLLVKTKSWHRGKKDDGLAWDEGVGVFGSRSCVLSWSDKLMHYPGSVVLREARRCGSSHS